MVGRNKLTRQVVIPMDGNRRLSRMLLLLCITAMLAGTVDAIRWTMSAERDDMRRQKAHAEERARVAEQLLSSFEVREQVTDNRAAASESIKEQQAKRALLQLREQLRAAEQELEDARRALRKARVKCNTTKDCRVRTRPLLAR